jgi:hypothetical protein
LSINLSKSFAFKSVDADETKNSVVADISRKINAWELLHTHSSTNVKREIKMLKCKIHSSLPLNVILPGLAHILVTQEL